MGGCRIVPDWLHSEEAATAIGSARTVIHLAGRLEHEIKLLAAVA
jgi:hypothetical protein